MDNISLGNSVDSEQPPIHIRILTELQNSKVNKEERDNCIIPFLLHPKIKKMANELIDEVKSRKS